MFNGRLVKRKWGYYITLLDRKHFKVKLLWFKPYGSCSRQFHKWRHELWLFVSGNGLMQIDGYKDGKYTLLEHPKGIGDYGVVFSGQKHQYTAHVKTLVLEIQYGLRCEEEDIVRL